MKNFTALLFVSFSVLLPEAAQAEVTRLGIRFGGGCHSSNVDGGCVINIVAFGGEFVDSPGVQLYTSPTRTGTFRRYSKFKRLLDEDGRARSRFRNIPGVCYQVRTVKVEGEKQVISNTLCEEALPTPTPIPAGTSTPSSSKIQVSSALKKP